MPKMKTHPPPRSGSNSRAGGKVLRRRAFSTHLLEHKSAKRRRVKRRPAEMAPADRPEALRLLGKR